MAINADQLAAELAKTLGAYTTEIAEEVKKAADETAAQLLSDIRSAAPKRKGKYRRAMAIKTTRDGPYERKKLWYVKAPYYRLQHLLERGHALRNGGRSKAYPHIEENEAKAKKAFTERVERIIKNGGK